MLIELYSVYYSAEEYRDMLDSLKADVNMLGVAQFNEFNTMSDYFDKKIRGTKL